MSKTIDSFKLIYSEKNNEIISSYFGIFLHKFRKLKRFSNVVMEKM